MTVGEIIEAVRYCYDEEDVNASSLANSTVLGSDNVLMDNIIKSKIGDAVRWICLYAPAEILGGTDEPDTEEGGQTVHHPTGILADYTPTDITAITVGSDVRGGRFDMGSDFIKLARVRVSDWHRAVRVPLAEDSEEYLQLYDDSGAMATADRPQAAIIDKTVKQIEVWPWASGKQIDVTYVSDVGDNSFDVTVTPSQGDPYTETHYPIPPKTKTAFIYYLAFLVLTAYEDSRAPRMLDIAKMNIGKNA